MQRFINPARFRHAQRLAQYRQPRIGRFASMSAAETDTQAANSSGITPASLTTTLTEKLEAKHVDINDMSGMFLMPWGKYLLLWMLM